MATADWTWLAPDGVTTSISVTPETLLAMTGMVGVAPLTVPGPRSNIFETYSDTLGWSQFAADAGAPAFTFRIFDAVSVIHTAVDGIADWNTLTLTQQREAIVAGLRQLNSPATGVPGASSPTKFFDENQDGPPAYSLVNLVEGDYTVFGTYQGNTRQLTSANDILWPSGQRGFAHCPSAFLPDPPTVAPAAETAGDDRISDTILAVIIAMSVLVCLLLLLIFHIRRKYRRKTHRPHDFENELSSFAAMSTKKHELVKPAEIRRKDVELDDVKGEGSTAIVYHGVMVDPVSRKPKEVAVKMLKNGSDIDARELLYQEAAFMAQLDHPNLLRCYGVVTVGQPWIVMDYCINGSLDSFLRQAAEKTRLKYSLASKIHLALDVANAMCYLSSRGLIHRDIAARNVFVDSAAECKLADFGLARNDTYYAASDRPVPIKWTAPEALTKGRFTTASDVWAFGILLVEIVLNGQLPYPGMSNEAVRVAVCAGGYRHPQMPEIPAEIYALMERCWHDMPSQRPTFDEIREELVRLEGTMEMMNMSQSMTPVNSGPLLSRELSANGEPHRSADSPPARHPSPNQLPQRKSNVTITIVENSSCGASTIPTRTTTDQSSMRQPHQSYEQAVITQANTKARALRNQQLTDIVGIGLPQVSGGSHTSGTAMDNPAGNGAPMTTSTPGNGSNGVETNASNSVQSQAPQGLAPAVLDKQASRSTVKSGHSAATEQSYSKAMAQPEVLRGTSALKIGHLPPMTRQDKDDESVSAPTEVTNVDDIGNDATKPPLLAQPSYQQALGQAPLSPGSLPRLHTVIEQDNEQDSNAVDVGVVVPTAPGTCPSSHPPPVERKDSYAHATLASGILSPGSLPKLSVPIVADDGTASKPGETVAVVTGPQGGGGSRPPLLKDGSYAVALGNMLSPGSLPKLRDLDGQESVV
eukprot:TRINITY_DN8384_c0_g2_i1.p1 TRINITY_DN8384_c0_g2~~TRINITY_DN8384_c0_g2_i1.p1  ORF type:complete len:1077 (+),score=245.27 TRINITY_DN8384_c0_g2_i1:456-3233(+)